MRRITVTLVFLTVIFMMVSPSFMGRTEDFWQTRDYSLEMKTFSCYAELKSFIMAGRLSTREGGVTMSSGGLMSQERLDSLQKTYGFGYTPSEQDNYYSKTNVQVEGVDEADIVKTDGEFIYVIRDSILIILKAYPPDEAGIVSRIQADGTIRGMLINGYRMLIFEETQQPLRTSIRIYDVFEKESPILLKTFSYDGYYFSSRMIDKHVYLVVNQGAYLDDGEVALPKKYYNGWSEATFASEIRYCDIPDYYYTFSTVVAANIETMHKPSEETILLGDANVIYVSLNNIYITSGTGGRTRVFRVHMEGTEISFAAEGEVPGYLLNQFSMDEHQGYFRIATSHGGASHVYVLDLNLSIVGKLEDLAKGERMHSARFMGDTCYLVTFKKVDPLFVIDLESPVSPRVLGELKVTGYSDYLHPYDEKHLIGIGKETAGGDERFSWYQGVKISLFDVSDFEDPKELAKCEIGDRGTDSPVLREHKALLFDRKKALLVIPIKLAEIDEAKYPYNAVPPNAFGDFVWQGVYVLNVSIEEGIIIRGRITHGTEPEFLGGDSYQNYVKRSLYIENVLYTFSDAKVKMHDLETLDEINVIMLQK